VVVRWLVIPMSMLVMILAGCGSDGGGTTTSTPAIEGGKARAIAGDWTGRLHA
jgi:hypothetical protein